MPVNFNRYNYMTFQYFSRPLLHNNFYFPKNCLYFSTNSFLLASSSNNDDSVESSRENSPSNIGDTEHLYDENQDLGSYTNNELREIQSELYGIINGGFEEAGMTSSQEPETHSREKTYNRYNAVKDQLAQRGIESPSSISDTENHQASGLSPESLESPNLYDATSPESQESPNLYDATSSESKDSSNVGSPQDNLDVGSPQSNDTDLYGVTSPQEERVTSSESENVEEGVTSSESESVEKASNARSDVGNNVVASISQQNTTGSSNNSSTSTSSDENEGKKDYTEAESSHKRKREDSNEEISDSNSVDMGNDSNNKRFKQDSSDILPDTEFPDIFDMGGGD
jgi:hypothetical protein